MELPVSLVLLAAASFAAPALAQGELPRGSTAVNQAFSPTSTVYWYSWVVGTAQGPTLPAPAGLAGGVATNLLAYLPYADVDSVSGNVSCAFRRSTDGGFTWGASNPLFVDSTWSSEESVILAEGHNVYFITIKNSGTELAVFASSDQGQTFTSANVSPGMAAGTIAYQTGDNRTARYENFAGGIRAVVEGGVVHIVYEVVENAGTAEAVYYTAVELNNGTITTVNPEVRVNTSAAGTSDCDYPRIDIDGMFVVVSWQEDGGAGDTANQIFSKISFAGGADLGTLPATQITNYVTPLASSTWGHESRIVVPNVYHTSEDSRNGTDAVHLHVSGDIGNTFNSAQVNVTGPVREHKLICEGNRVGVIYHGSNGIYAVIDNTNGLDILAGNAVEVPVSGGTNSSSGSQDILFAADMREDVIVTAYEASGSAGEDCYLGVSTDGGVTFQDFPVSQGQGDVDEPYCRLTANYDVVYSWIDNRSCGSGNGCNETFVSGMKLPLLTDDVANANVEVSLGDMAAGDFALIAVTENGTAPSPLNNFGFAPNLDIFSDPTKVFLPEIQLVDSQGLATFTSMTPSVRQLVSNLGITAYVAVITIRLDGTFGSFTDPVTIQ